VSPPGNAGGPAPRLAQFGLLGLLDRPALTQIAKAAVGGGAPTISGEVALGTPAPVSGTVVNLAVKAEYVVKKGQLTVQATSTNIEPVGSAVVPSLQVYNASTGALIGIIRVANINNGIGTFTGAFNVSSSLTSVAVQDFAGGVAIAAVAQK
jgi:hypothetical protein